MEQHVANHSTSRDRFRDARFEFRAWNVRTDLVDRLESDEGFGEPTVVRDRYVIGPIDSVNVKIRDGDVQVKRLLEVRARFQRWCPTWKQTTPLDHDEVVRLWGELGLSPPTRTHVAGGIAELASEDPDLLLVDVTKLRRHGTVRGVSVELSEIRRGGHATVSVGLESTDLPRLRTVRAHAGLEGYENVAVHVAVGHRWTRAPTTPT